MMAFAILMLPTIDLVLFPAVCILDILHCIVSFWIFCTISFALDTIFVMKIPLWISWMFSLDPSPLYIDFVDASLHCNGMCLSYSTLLNIIVILLYWTYYYHYYINTLLNIIIVIIIIIIVLSSQLLLLLSILIAMLVYLKILLVFILRVASFTSSCVIFFLSTLGSWSMIFLNILFYFSSCRFSGGLVCSKLS